MRSTSVLVEEVHDLLEILGRQTRVDRRRLDVGVTQMLLHRAEITAGPFEKLHAARMAKRVGGGWCPRPRACRDPLMIFQTR